MMSREIYYLMNWVTALLMLTGKTWKTCSTLAGFALCETQQQRIYVIDILFAMMVNYIAFLLRGSTEPTRVLM